MSRTEKAIAIGEATRTPVPKLSDAWISHTIIEAFTTAGLKSPVPVETESVLLAPENRVASARVYIPDAMIDGEEVSILSLNPKRSFYKSLLVMAKDKRESWESQSPSDFDYFGLAETMEQNIEFATAAYKMVEGGRAASDAIGAIAREEWTSYVQAGIRSEEANKKITESIDFASDVFRLHNKIRTS